MNYDLTPDSNLSLSALVYDHETGKGRPYFYDELTLDQYWVNYTGKISGTDVKGIVYLNRAEKTAFQDSANDDYASLLRQEEMPANVWGVDFQTNLTLGESTGLTLGAAYKRASWDYDDIYTSGTRTVGATGKQQSVSPFANLNLRFPEKHVIITLAPGMTGSKHLMVQTGTLRAVLASQLMTIILIPAPRAVCLPKPVSPGTWTTKPQSGPLAARGSVLPAYSNFTRSMSGVGNLLPGSQSRP